MEKANAIKKEIERLKYRIEKYEDGRINLFVDNKPTKFLLFEITELETKMSIVDIKDLWGTFLRWQQNTI